jgi:hypothetical protein
VVCGSAWHSPSSGVFWRVGGSFPSPVPGLDFSNFLCGEDLIKRHEAIEGEAVDVWPAKRAVFLGLLLGN